MIVQLFAVVDRVSGIVDGPHKAVNEGQFLRSFADSCRDPKGGIHNHPEDFYAVHLGSYDDSNGNIVGNDDGARRIADATDFTRPLTDEEK